jgi:hypothetical protein
MYCTRQGERELLVAVDRFLVEEGTIMLFARAVGDPNPIYANPEYAENSEVGTIIAPPTYVQSSAQFDPDYPLRPKLGTPWFGSGKNATGRQASAGAGGASGAGLHAEQHFEYHRSLRPGDVLSATTRKGEGWEKQGRSGKLVFSEMIVEYRDQSGELVVTARSVGVMTEGPAARKDG